MTDQTLSAADGLLCVYPAYLNSRKSIAEGRRIAKERGCDNPTYNEIKDVCTAAGLKPIVENKLYPRELYRGDVMFRGRIRVELKKADGTLVNEKIPNKKALLLHLGEMIPKLKTRSAKGSGDSTTSQQQSKSKKKKKR